MDTVQYRKQGWLFNIVLYRYHVCKVWMQVHMLLQHMILRATLSKRVERWQFIACVFWGASPERQVALAVPLSPQATMKAQGLHCCLKRGEWGPSWRLWHGRVGKARSEKNFVIGILYTLSFLFVTALRTVHVRENPTYTYVLCTGWFKPEYAYPNDFACTCMNDSWGTLAQWR